MKVILRGLLLGPLLSGAFEDNPRVRQGTALAYIFAGAAAYLIIWAAGLHFAFFWAFVPPLYCLLHGVWLWRVSRPAS